MKKEKFKFFIAVTLYTFSPKLFAGEMNFAGLFDGLAGNSVQQQRKIEEKIENNINTFRSIASSRVIIPGNEVSRVESLWGLNEAKVLSVEVILNLKIRKRLTQNEFKGISNLVTSALSEKNLVVQPLIHDEEGFEWTDENPEAKTYFKAATAENEIWDILKANWGKDVQWKRVHVSEKDGSCKIDGSFETAMFDPNLKLRREVMGLVGELCPNTRLALTPKINGGLMASSDFWYLWLERLAFIVLGFAVWGLLYALMKLKKVDPAEDVDGDEGAIILTKIVERSPDQAAKWMVKAMLSESKAKDLDNSSKPQIFDQSP